MRRLRMTVFGVLMSLEPAIAALSGFVLLHEHLRPRAWVALVMVMVASAGVSRTQEPGLPPDTPHFPQFGSARVDPGRPYVHVMVYRVGTLR